jgi:hypothetical protein
MSRSRTEASPIAGTGGRVLNMTEADDDFISAALSKPKTVEVGDETFTIKASQSHYDLEVFAADGMSIGFVSRISEGTSGFIPATLVNKVTPVETSSVEDGIEFLRASATDLGT